MNRTSVIRKCKKGDGESGKPWCLYSKDDQKLLGRHPTKEKAEAQEAAIQISKHSIKGLLQSVMAFLQK